VQQLVRPERPDEAGPGYWLLFNGGEHVTAVEERQSPVEGTPAAANWSIRTTQFHERKVISVVVGEQRVGIADAEGHRSRGSIGTHCALVLS